MGELDPEAIVGAATLLLATLGGGVLWIVRQALGSVGGRRILAALAADVERREDGSPAPRPGGDGELLADAIATRVHDRIEPELQRLSDGLDAVRAEQDKTLEREAERSREVRTLQLQLTSRISRLEGKTGVAIPQDQLDAEATPISGIPLEIRRVKP